LAVRFLACHVRVPRKLVIRSADDTPTKVVNLSDRERCNAEAIMILE
jgi:hypothetical protein